MSTTNFIYFFNLFFFSTFEITNTRSSLAESDTHSQRSHTHDPKQYNCKQPAGHIEIIIIIIKSSIYLYTSTLKQQSSNRAAEIRTDWYRCALVKHVFTPGLTSYEDTHARIQALFVEKKWEQIFMMRPTMILGNIELVVKQRADRRVENTEEQSNNRHI